MAKRVSESEQQEQPSFEAALKRLEEIVAQMESGDLGLDALVAAFEEGQKLVKQCSGKLNEVERRIEILVKDEAGDVVARPFAAEQE